MSGYYCTRCSELGRKCPEYHNCLCGNLGLVWEDGWVECEPCARARIIEERNNQLMKCECCNESKKELVQGLCWKCKIQSVSVPPIEVRKKT